MPKIPTPLTDTQIKNAKPKEKEYNLSDGKGLQLRIKPSGSKVWLFNYFRPYLKKRANLKIGDHPYPHTSLADARKKRDEYLALLSKNIDPQTFKREEDAKKKQNLESTFENTSRLWLEVKRSKVSANYATDVQRSLEIHLFPFIGKVPLTKLTAPMVISVLKPLESKGSLETVRRLIQRINEVMTYALNTGLVASNPLSGISAAFLAPVVKNQSSIKPQELPELMYSLQRASIKFTTRCLIEWQLHTLTRPVEAARAEWSEINIDNAVWTIPASKMKMNRDHHIPLTNQSLAILEQMKPISERSKYVFPSDRSLHNPANEQTANMALKRMGFKSRLVAHGLRSIGSTALNEQGFDSDIIEAALAHLDKNQVRAAYNRTDYLERRRVMMSWWSEFIENASYGSLSVAGKKGLKIVNNK